MYMYMIVQCMYIVLLFFLTSTWHACTCTLYTLYLLADEEEEDEDVEEDEEQEIITVVYFWQGRDASEMGWLHFTHG